jgi:CheY-like chemotaxis protein
MNAIIGMSHLALKTSLDNRQRDYLHKIQQSSQHLLGIINDILDLSKIEAGKLELDPHEFTLEEMITKVGNLVGEKAGDKGLELLFDVAPDVPARLIGDDLRLSQMLVNYANNAVKFTETVEIDIVVQVRQREADRLQLYFAVRDTGIGLTPEQQAKLFQSFQQADNSITRKFGGTGLGLAISKRLAELQGGEIGVRSRLGQGSTFWFTVHLEVPEQEPAPSGRPSAIPDTSRLAHRKVLLAEDNILNQELACELLHNFGLAVDVASNGEVAVNMARRNHYDLILMDMQMPVMDGLSAAKAIRLMPELTTIPILAMTANAMNSDRDKCMQAGMNDHLPKPIDPALLARKLLQWIASTAPTA